ncbi:FtsX-like permease family protein [Streptomyces sp. NPDC058525]|uniref:FtsX-like permease family protein n=1 Tax=Streptomyces sp. NPDC058525 TaxID=3346538 RepID=UPI00366A19F4
MNAVWRASRAAVKRRRVQTFVIGLVVLCSTTTVLLALGLIAAASGPFDQAYAAQRGAHVVASFDTSKVSAEQLAGTGGRPGVEAAAGPFGQAAVAVPRGWLGSPGGSLTVVGRADPGGPVDRVEILRGRWAAAPGEIVVNWSFAGAPSPELLGTRLAVPGGGQPLTVVGFAASMSQSAGAWVTPEQLAALGPASAQMLYRFADSATDAQLRSGLAGATARLPGEALTHTQTHLALEQAFSALADAYLPFMSLFGVLGILVSCLIVANVVSGAVVSGYRHIGVLKALGFTPNQVVAVYLTMVSVPAVAGGVLGTLLGNALAGPVLKVSFSGIQTGRAAVGAVPPWVYVVCLLGMPALVLLTALVPALRAHRLPAARAISAGTAPRTGRGLRVQRVLGSTRLPRGVSLGLGQPFSRPGRTLLTMAAIVLGVTTVTLSTGLTSTMLALGQAAGADGGARVLVHADAQGNRPAPRLGDAQIEERLRALPGARHVRARGLAEVGLSGQTQPAFANFYRGNDSSYAYEIVEGRLPDAAGEIAAGPSFLTQRGLRIGDRVTLELDGRQVATTVVGRLIEGNARSVDASWETFEQLAPGARPIEYDVRLSPGADPAAYAAAAEAADPGLSVSVEDGGSAATVTVVTFSVVFTVLLTLVASLGVFNTVLLNTRERRRDLGMLKSIGMTPRQVVVMTVTSVAGLGVAGGLLGIPLGMLAHRLVVDNVGVVEFPESMKDVWHAPQLAAMLLAGVAIAVLGALLPARSAARMTIASVLHTE